MSDLNGSTTNLRVQFGCGFHAPAGWRNFDASPTLRFERIPLLGRAARKNGQRFPANVEFGDIVKGLPVGSNSCAAVYASHVLEHLSLNDFRTALANTFRIFEVRRVVSAGRSRFAIPGTRVRTTRAD